MADNTEFRQHIIRDWRDALDAVRRAGASTIAVDVTAMAIILDAALTPPSAPESQEAARHIGGNANAEDCPACSGTNPPYPFICPGEDTDHG